MLNDNTSILILNCDTEIASFLSTVKYLKQVTIQQIRFASRFLNNCPIKEVVFIIVEKSCHNRLHDSGPNLILSFFIVVSVQLSLNHIR